MPILLYFPIRLIQYQNGRNTFSFLHLQQNYKQKVTTEKKTHCLFLLGLRRWIEILFCFCLHCILLLLKQLLINRSQQITMYWTIVCKKKLNRTNFIWNSGSNSYVLIDKCDLQDDENQLTTNFLDAEEI